MRFGFLLNEVLTGLRRNVTMTVAMILTTAADFRDALPARGRLIGLDVGTKTIGVALCDADWTIASPAELLRRGKFSADLANLGSLAGRQQAKGVVIGLHAAGALRLDDDPLHAATVGKIVDVGRPEFGRDGIVDLLKGNTECRCLLAIDARRCSSDRRCSDAEASLISSA